MKWWLPRSPRTWTPKIQQPGTTGERFVRQAYADLKATRVRVRSDPVTLFAAVIECTWMVLVFASSVPTTVTRLRRELFGHLLVAQDVDVLAVEKHVHRTVRDDAGLDAIGVGRPHPHLRRDQPCT